MPSIAYCSLSLYAAPVVHLYSLGYERPVGLMRVHAFSPFLFLVVLACNCGGQ